MVMVLVWLLRCVLFFAIDDRMLVGCPLRYLRSNCHRCRLHQQPSTISPDTAILGSMPKACEEHSNHQPGCAYVEAQSNHAPETPLRYVGNLQEASAVAHQRRNLGRRKESCIRKAPHL